MYYFTLFPITFLTVEGHCFPTKQHIQDVHEDIVDTYSTMAKQIFE